MKYVLREIQTKPHASTWFLGGEEWLTDALQHFVGHTIAAIDHQQPPLVAGQICFQLDIRPG